MKKLFLGTMTLLIMSLLVIIVGCKKDDSAANSGGGGSSGGGSSYSAPSTPTGLSAVVDGSSIKVSWNSVYNANSYRVKWGTDGSYYSYTFSETTNNYIYDNSPSTNNYYKVMAINDYGESDYSAAAYCYYSTGGGGGGGGGGGTTTPPNAPTGVSAYNAGSTAVPNICISWNSVSGADTYKVYRSTSANGSYSQIGSAVSYTYLYDQNPKDGNNYYKVKAFNSAGSSSYSDYAVCNYNANAYSPCPPSITGSANSSSATIRWTYSTSSGCGAPTKVVVKMQDPDSGNWISGNEQSSSVHSYTCYSVNTWVNQYGWVKFGVVVSNDYGSSSKTISYNPYTGEWIGG